MEKQLATGRLTEWKIFTLAELIELLSCSAITAKRRLRTWRTLTSINRNGRYHALPGVPAFDEKGLWSYREVYFSSHGNLKQTAVWLVQQAPRGLDSQELGGLVGLSARSSYLSRLRDLPGLHREWLDGKWVYLAEDEAERKRQLAERSRWVGQSAGLPTDTEAVDILVCLIRHPELGPEELAGQLVQQGRGVAVAKIRNLLEKHDLLKKTLGCGPSAALTTTSGG